LVFVGVSEIDFDEGAASSGIVKNCSDNSSGVSLSLREVKVAISGGSNSFALGSGIDTTLFTFSLA
jgi:hypothetical protein